MNNYIGYAIEEFIKSGQEHATENIPVSGSPTEEPAGNIVLDLVGDEKWMIDKTYSELDVMYIQGRLNGLSWHLEDGSILFVPLTSKGKVNNKNAFIFSTIITTQDGSSFHSFIVTEDDALTYVTEEVGGGGMETAFRVVGTTPDGKPDVSEPSTQIIYLTRDPDSAATDPYTEWIYTEDSQWEIIGETSINLDDYCTSEEVDSKLSEKVDKVEGKGLSTKDFTEALEEKLTALPDSSELDSTIGNITAELSDLDSGKVDKVEGKGLSANDYTNADKTKLSELPTNGELQQELGGKANKSEMSVVAGTGEDSDKTTITLKSGTSATVLTEHQDISGKVDKVEGKGLSTEDYTTAEKEKLNNVENVYATKQEVSGAIADAHTHSNKAVLDDITAPYTTEEQAKLSELPTGTALEDELSAKADKSEMSVVAGTGEDSDKATITLKEGTSATVLTEHQDISGKANIEDIPSVYVESASVSDNTLTLTPHEGEAVIFTVDTGTWEHHSYSIPKETVMIGGRAYPYVRIGNQLWLAENLDLQWDGLTIGHSSRVEVQAASYYNNDPDTYGLDGTYKCGLLYNWYAVKYLNDNKATMLPAGWHVPSETEFETMVAYIGGASSSSGKLKAKSGSITAEWPLNTWTGTDDYGMSILPSGLLNSSGSTPVVAFQEFNRRAFLWTRTVASSGYTYVGYDIRYDDNMIVSSNYDAHSEFSLRLVKDVTA